MSFHLLPDLGRRRVAEVTSANVQRLHLKLRAKPYAANRALALLSKMFSLAIAAGWRPDNPCRGVARFQEEKRQRWLSDIELGRLLDVLNQYPNRPAANAVKLLLLTGARRGEVLLAKWADLDIERGSWTKPAHTTKQRRTETVPLSGAALRLLASMRAEDRASEYLLGGDGLTVDHSREGLGRNHEGTQLEGVRLHDLRHTFASHWYRAACRCISSGRCSGMPIRRQRRDMLIWRATHCATRPTDSDRSWLVSTSRMSRCERFSVWNRDRAAPLESSEQVSTSRIQR